MSANCETMGERLNQLMADQNVKPSALARHSGVSRMTIWQIRNDKIHDHKNSTIENLAAELNVKPEYLLYGKGDED